MMTYAVLTFWVALESGSQADVVLSFLQANCNLMCGPEYSAATKGSMALISEKETSFELVEALLKYIESLQVAGAVLIFLPGWNLIYSMQRHLETNPHFGNSLGNNRLHSQMPGGHLGSPGPHAGHVQPLGFKSGC